MSLGNSSEGQEEEPRKRGNQESIVLEHGIRNRNLVFSYILAFVRLFGLSSFWSLQCLTVTSYQGQASMSSAHQNECGLVYLSTIQVCIILHYRCRHLMASAESSCPFLLVHGRFNRLIDDESCFTHACPSLWELRNGTIRRCQPQSPEFDGWKDSPCTFPWSLLSHRDHQVE